MHDSGEYSTVSSATLLKARQGDDDAWGRIWTQYSSRILRQTLRFGIGLTDAEGITLDVFRKVWARLDDFSRNGTGQSLGAWINRITQTTALDFLKQQRRAPQDLGSGVARLVAPESSNADDDHAPSAVWLALWRAQGIVENECSDRSWECFRLVRFAQLPHSEIAEMLEMSVSNVSTTANRVFQKIREQCLAQLRDANLMVDQEGRLVPCDTESLTDR